jgi:hypothetical protein
LPGPDDVSLIGKHFQNAAAVGRIDRSHPIFVEANFRRSLHGHVDSPIANLLDADLFQLLRRCLNDVGRRCRCGLRRLFVCSRLLMPHHESAE